MDHMVTIFFLCLTNSLNITFLIILMALMVPLLKKYFSAVCLYRLWVVLLIALLIPMRFNSLKALFYISLPRITIENNASDDSGKQDCNEFNNAIAKDTQSKKQLPPDITMKGLKEISTENLKLIRSIYITYIVQNRYVLLSLLWLLGAIILLLRKGIQYGKYLKRLQSMLPINQENIKEDYNRCIRELYSNDRKRELQYDTINIYKCSIITSPMTVGILKPAILFPEQSCLDRDFYFILKHELIHIRRRDSWMKLVRLIVMALNWYNPFCYILSGYLDQWCEISCDELVVHNSTREDCINYSKLLLKYAAVKRTASDTINMIGGKDNMKDRLHSIMAQRKKYSGKTLVVLLVCIAFTTVIVSTITHNDVLASGDNATTQAPLVNYEEMSDNVDKVTIAPTSPSLRETVVEYAKQAKGTPYLWGGNDLSIGVDCSGFTQAIYKKIGYDLPRTSREQADLCKRVSMDSLQEGDLIFYAGSSDIINHVGIYIGENKIIHAKNMRDGVTIQEINYRKPFSAGRLITD